MVQDFIGWRVPGAWPRCSGVELTAASVRQRGGREAHCTEEEPNI